MFPKRFSLAWVVVLLGAGQVEAAFFMGLGDLPGGTRYSAAWGVSADGSVVVGTSNSTFGPESFRWTRKQGMTGLGDLAGGDFHSSSLGVSADGQVIVGVGHSPLGGEAYRWTAASGMVGLGDLPGGIDNSAASATSADGSVVVGQSSSELSGPTLDAEAFRWTEASGLVPLGDLPGGDYFSQARGVSADGSVVVGGSSSSLSSSAYEAFRWTEAGGMVGIGVIGEAFGVSANGAVVVGGIDSPSRREAFRWTVLGGLVGLGFLDDVNQVSQAHGVSADGSVVVGLANGGGAFVWDGHNGMRSVADLLTDAGVDINGWYLSLAKGVSADGSIVVGYGTNPAGDHEAWIANVGGRSFSSVADGTWIAADTWDAGVLTPSEDDDVIINDRTVTVAGTSAARSLSLRSAQATLRVDSGAFLDVGREVLVEGGTLDLHGLVFSDELCLTNGTMHFAEDGVLDVHDSVTLTDSKFTVDIDNNTGTLVLATGVVELGTSNILIPQAVESLPVGDHALTLINSFTEGGVIGTFYEPAAQKHLGFGVFHQVSCSSRKWKSSFVWVRINP